MQVGTQHVMTAVQDRHRRKVAEMLSRHDPELRARLVTEPDLDGVAVWYSQGLFDIAAVWHEDGVMRPYRSYAPLITFQPAEYLGLEKSAIVDKIRRLAEWWMTNC